MATLVDGVMFDRVGDLTGRRLSPAFIDEIHEVWGSRYVDLDNLGEEERGNKLSASARRLEYAIHGKFARSETDKNGLHAMRSGCR